MIKQDFTLSPEASSPDAKPSNGSRHVASRSANGMHYVWEVRHAGLLGIKYEVAVRTDLVDDETSKLEDGDPSSGKEVLRGIVDAAVLGCVWASSLIKFTQD